MEWVLEWEEDVLGGDETDDNRRSDEEPKKLEINRKSGELSTVRGNTNFTSAGRSEGSS